MNGRTDRQTDRQTKSPLAIAQSNDARLKHRLGLHKITLLTKLGL